jgi:GTPase
VSARRPMVAIVGRPNVGKSTLFNRLLHRRRAIVEDTPGVTRDRHHADAEVNGRLITLVDTGGFLPDSKEEPLARLVRLQAQAAVEECELVLLVVDARTGITAGDEDVARFLRRQKRPVILVVNKCDDHRQLEAHAAPFYQLGLGEPLGVSAEHNEGVQALVERMVASLPPAVAERAPDEGGPDDAGEPTDRPLRIALVGRPNVGKSTLVNALLGQQRVIVSPVAGTTRDPIDTALTYRDRDLVLVDTAGIRRKATISQKVEQFSVFSALRAVEDSDVTVLVLDASEAGVEQDQKIAALAEEKGRALLLCVNKWDLMHGKVTEEAFRTELKWVLKWVAWAPMVFVSAQQGKKVTRVLDLALELARQQYVRAPTPLLNRVLEHVTTEHPLPVLSRGRQLKLYYVAQVGTAPPAFAITCNAPDQVPDRYQRYVANHLRATLDLKVPLRLFWRERPGQKQRKQRAERFAARDKSRSRK